MIYSQYGSKVEVISQIDKDGTIWVKRLSDATKFNVPVISLKATGGIQEIAGEAEKYRRANKADREFRKAFTPNRFGEYA